jgi:hypothetical protein
MGKCKAVVHSRSDLQRHFARASCYTRGVKTCGTWCALFRCRNRAPQSSLRSHAPPSCRQLHHRSPRSAVVALCALCALLCSPAAHRRERRWKYYAVQSYSQSQPLCEQHRIYSRLSGSPPGIACLTRDRNPNRDRTWPRSSIRITTAYTQCHPKSKGEEIWLTYAHDDT